jgi:hypothetical protein
MLNASDDWKSAFVAAILGESKIAAEVMEQGAANLVTRPETKGIANMLHDRAEDIRLAKQETLAFEDWSVV